MHANRNGCAGVFALKDIRYIQIVVSNEREHITILNAIRANRGTIPNITSLKVQKQGRNTFVYMKKKQS